VLLFLWENVCVQTRCVCYVHHVRQAFSFEKMHDMRCFYLTIMRVWDHRKYMPKCIPNSTSCRDVNDVGVPKHTHLPSARAFVSPGVVRGLMCIIRCQDHWAPPLYDKTRVIENVWHLVTRCGDARVKPQWAHQERCDGHRHHRMHTPLVLFSIRVRSSGNMLCLGRCVMTSYGVPLAVSKSTLLGGHRPVTMSQS